MNRASAADSQCGAATDHPAIWDAFPDCNPVDCTWPGGTATPKPCPLERGTRGGRAAEQAVRGHQRHLTIGADVDQQLPLAQRRGKQCAGQVPAQISADAGRQINLYRRRKGWEPSPGAVEHAEQALWDIGSGGDARWIQPCRQMEHGCVSGEHHAPHSLFWNADCFKQGDKQPVQLPQDRFPQWDNPFLRNGGDPGDYIRAIGGLRIQLTGGWTGPAKRLGEADQINGNRCSADVGGERISLRPKQGAALPTVDLSGSLYLRRHRFPDLDSAVPHRLGSAGEPPVFELFPNGQQPAFFLGERGECAVCADLAFSAGMRTPAGFRQRNLCLLKQSGKQGGRIQREHPPCAGVPDNDSCHLTPPPFFESESTVQTASVRHRRSQSQAALPRAGRWDSAPTGKAAKTGSAKRLPAPAAPIA